MSVEDAILELKTGKMPACCSKQSGKSSFNDVSEALARAIDGKDPGIIECIKGTDQPCQLDPDIAIGSCYYYTRLSKRKLRRTGEGDEGVRLLFARS